MIYEIGRHKVQCQDVMLGLSELMGEDQADFVYSDPPWGQGNLKYWQTINNRHTGAMKSDIKYNDFLHRYFKLLSTYAKDVAVIEYGQKWRDDIRFTVSEYGFSHHGCCTSLYKSGSKLYPLDVHLISKSGNYSLNPSFEEGCFNLRGLKLVKHAFQHYCPKNASIVLDPMCGMGYTAQTTKDMGLIFRGNELNQKRLDKTIKRLKS